MRLQTEKSGMKFVSKHLFILIVLSLPGISRAQLDSSYELLLGTHARGGETDSTVPLKSSTPKRKRKPANEVTPTNVESPVVTTTPTPAPPPAPIAKEEPSFSQQAKSLLGTDADKVNDFYDEHFDEADPRHNKVEISFAPAFVTSESSSNFSYRNYRSVFTAMNLGANVWLTPALGVGGSFLFSLGADTSGDAVTNTRTIVRYELLDMAIKFRKFFGFSSTSKSMEFDILYSDYKTTVPADDLYRARLKTSGLGAKMTLRVPSSAEVAWLVGGSFYPRLQHAEEKTGLNISSGNNTENTRVGLQLGSEITLSRQAQLFYEASVTSEKNLFDGSAALIDPATGNTPKNVSVTNTFYMFSLGYRWGN
jgi:hypothetical protein